MVLNVVDNYTIRKVTMYSSFTCVYIPIAILLLLYTNNLYNIGKISMLCFLFGLLVAECIKLSFTLLINSSSKDQKLKVKRYCSKLKIKEIFKCLLTITTVVIIFYIVAVLFGAPILSEQEETLMLSLLIAIFTAVPACLNLGSEITVSLLSGIKPVSGDLMQDMMSTCIKTTLLGAWLGAVVIPLDWDRPWQAWPIPCSLGAIVGYIIGHIATLVKLMPSIAKLFSKSYGRCK